MNEEDWSLWIGLDFYFISVLYEKSRLFSSWLNGLILMERSPEWNDLGPGTRLPSNLAKLFTRSQVQLDGA